MTNEEFIESISLPNEIWKDIVGFEGSYMISSNARVISLNRIRKNGQGYVHWHPHLLKTHISKTGYCVVDLHINCKRKTAKVHRLIAEAFIPQVQDKPYIDHINGIRTDNRLSNLRWCTIKENSNFPIAKMNQSKSHKGKKLSPEHVAKLTAYLIGRKVSNKTRQKISDKLSKAVIQMDINGNVITVYKSARQASLTLNISYKHISSCCLGRQKTCGGYIWKFQ